MSQNGCLLCAPLVAESVHEMLSQMRLAKDTGADVVELRIDYIRDFVPEADLPSLIQGRVLPVIVTYRPKWEGGKYEGDEIYRLEALRKAIQLGADFVDVELQVAMDFVKRCISDRKASGTRIIVSNHNYKTTPSLEEVGSLIARIQSTGADVVKIVSTAEKVTDVARIFHAVVHSQVSGNQVPTIALVMGSKGLISRLLAPKFGSFLTFGALGAGQESAPGQPTLYQLTKTYKLSRINRDTKVFGIVGNPVGHSKGPILHNAAFQEIDYDAVYIPYLVDDVTDFLEVYSGFDFAGFSVTIPFKEDALKCCDEVDPVSQAIGAVNTIIRKDGKLVGYNTDCEAAITAIEDALQESRPLHEHCLAGKLFVVIGAGGAGKALAYGAKQRGARVVIANRNFERAKLLADSVGAEAIPLEHLDDFQPEFGMVLANTTSVGMQPNVQDTPISKGALKAYSIVFDAVYTPRCTRLLKEAEEAGAVSVSGLEMFIRQAIGQFEIFTGQKAPRELMRKIITQNA